jgi:hypothetical protein
VSRAGEYPAPTPGDPATPEAIRAWVADAEAATFWPMSYALAWATFGTLEPLAAWSIRGRDLLGSDPLSGGFSTLRTALNSMAAQEQIFARPYPMRAFRRALEAGGGAGGLTVLGRRRNAGELLKIHPSDWRCLAFVDPMGGTGPAAYFEYEAPKRDRFWTDLAFERAEVQAAFDAAREPGGSDRPTREQELWVQRLLVKSEWNYAETLSWVTFRNADDVGANLNYGASGLMTDPYWLVEAVCKLRAREDATAVETEPAAALLVELIAGRVEAAADFPDRSNGARPWPLDRAEWQYLTFRGGSGLPDGGAIVDSRTWRGHGSRDGVFINVRFLRETVMNAFKADDVEAAPALRLDAPEEPRWKRRLGGPKMHMGARRVLTDPSWGQLPSPELSAQDAPPVVIETPAPETRAPPAPSPGWTKKGDRYRDREWLLWAAKHQRVLSGKDYKGATVRGLARAFADAELPAGSPRKGDHWERVVGRICKAISTRREWRNLGELTAASAAA